MSLAPLADSKKSLLENPLKIFFLETSGRSVLNPRQACAIESSAQMSGMDAIIVSVLSPILDLGNNVTCLLATQFHNVHFR